MSGLEILQQGICRVAPQVLCEVAYMRGLSPHRPILGRRGACCLGEKTKNPGPTISLRLREALCGPTNSESQPAEIAGGRQVFARYRMPHLVIRQMDVMIGMPMLLEPGHQFVRHHVSGPNLVVFS